MHSFTLSFFLTFIYFTTDVPPTRGSPTCPLSTSHRRYNTHHCHIHRLFSYVNMYVIGSRHCYCIKGRILHCSSASDPLTIRRTRKCTVTSVVWKSGKCLDVGLYGGFNISCPNRNRSCFCGNATFVTCPPMLMSIN